MTQQTSKELTPHPSGRGTPDPMGHARAIGYSDEEIRSVPEGAVCHGCGNPTAWADLNEGETVLDVGSGGGLDAFLAARRVGQKGKVIGVDASAGNIAKATENAAKGRHPNVVFKQGEMEKLPVDDHSVDVVISNCVLNYAADKLAAFKEIFRRLKPSGRMVVTDLTAEGEFSTEVLHDKVWGEWLAKASGKDDYLKTVEKAGFREVVLVQETTFPMAEGDERLRGKIVSIAVKAYK
jgi:ubiquinone/menaquinone biosynthesis C-methylase UbiE